MASVLRTIEVEAESERTWEDAAAQAVENLGRQLVKNINSIHVENLHAGGEDGEKLCYRVEVKISLGWSRPALAPAIEARRRAEHDRNRRLSG